MILTPSTVMPVHMMDTLSRTKMAAHMMDGAGLVCGLLMTDNLLACVTCMFLKYTGSWWHSIVVRPPVLAGELSLSCSRLTAGCVTTLWVKRPL